MPSAFVDTNVLVYAADEALSDARKTRVARALLCQRDLHLSVQVLNDFTVNARHPFKLNLSPLQQREWLSRWLLFPVAPLTVDTFLTAQRFHTRFQISRRDSLIIASAVESNCGIVFSEDLSHNQVTDR